MNINSQLSFPSIEKQIGVYASIRKKPQGSAIPELYATLATVTDRIKDYMQNTDSQWGAAEIQELTSRIDKVTSKLNPENFSHWKMIKSSMALARIVEVFNKVSGSQNRTIKQAINYQKLIYGNFDKSICSEIFHTKPLLLFTANQPLSIGMLNKLTLDDKMQYFLIQFDALLKEDNATKKDPHLGTVNSTAIFLRHDIEHYYIFEGLLQACSELKWDLYGELKELYKLQQELSLKDPRLGNLLEVALFIIFHESPGMLLLEAPDIKDDLEQNMGEHQLVSSRLSDCHTVEDYIKKLDYIISNAAAFKTRSERYKLAFKDLEGLLKTILDKNHQPFLDSLQKNQTSEEKMDRVKDAYSRFWQEVLDILSKKR